MRVTRQVRNFSLAALMLTLVSVSASAARRPRYIFELPDGYVGWVQIIFNDPNASPLQIADGGLVLDVPETGIVRTSSLRVHSSLAPDEFVYKPSGVVASPQVPVPTNHVLPGVEHGGFGVMDTGGRGKGYSWFIFIGSPRQRKSTPFADWDAVVNDWRKLHGAQRAPAPDPYPTPGRISTGN